MAINWGDYEFSSIEQLDKWDAPEHGGIYVITFKKNPDSEPNTYTVLYFGETENFAERGIGESHHKYNCWKYHAYQKPLYVSTHQVFSNEVREAREKKLISTYNPVCNDT